MYKLLSEQNKNLEETVKTRTLELENKAFELKGNIQELKDFTFIASHDLQEPLRKVICFGERLRVNYQELLDGRAREYIAVMEKASLRMQKLIDGLLQLSRERVPSTCRNSFSLNNSLSTSAAGIAAQLTVTIGLSLRGLMLWIARASSSLPVPVSP